MRGVPDQKHPPDPVAVREPRVHRIDGRPCNRADRDVASGPAGRQRRQSLGAEINVPLRGRARLQLKEIGAGERTEHDLLAARAEAMPDVAAEALEIDIGDNRTHAQRLAGEADAERVAHEATAAVGADEEARADGFAAGLGDDALAVLRKASQFASEFGRCAEFGQTLAHQGFGEELRRHQRPAIRLGRRGSGGGVADRLVHVISVGAVPARRRIGPSDREQPVDEAEVLEHFQAPRLEALAARAAKRRLRLLDQPEIDAAPGKVDRQRKPRRAGAANQYVSGRLSGHDTAPKYVYIAHIRARLRVKEKVQNTHIPRRALRTLHEALIDVVGFTNRPQNDVILLREAGVSLDRALFPLLVLIQRRGPLAIGELADWIGRDYTTVSRQVAKLETLGLVARRAGQTDARVTEAIVTEKGQAISDMLDAARERLARNALAGWSKDDLAEFARLLRRFADSLIGRTEKQ